MFVKNVVALTTMISRHVEKGFFQDVVELFLVFLLDFGICFNIKLLYFILGKQLTASYKEMQIVLILIL